MMLLHLLLSDLTDRWLSASSMTRWLTACVGAAILLGVAGGALGNLAALQPY